MNSRVEAAQGATKMFAVDVCPSTRQVFPDDVTN